MNKKLGESLSALMDGEADSKALDEVLDSVQDPTVRDAWRRFHVASHGLRSGAVAADADLSGRIMAALDSEPAYSARPASDSNAEAGSIGESLSALMDGEADEATLQQVLDNVGDPALRSTWQRFNTVSHALQAGTLTAGTDLSGRIMAAIEQEPGISAQPTPAEIPEHIQNVGGWQRLLRPVVSFAVAASVFAVVLVGSQFYGSQNQLAAGAPVVVAGADRLAPSSPVTVLDSQATANLAGYASPSAVVQRTAPPAASEVAPGVDYNAVARQRLERYMLDHAEEAALNAPQGMMPYARVATFSTGE